MAKVKILRIIAVGLLLVLGYSCPLEQTIFTVLYNGNGNTGGNVPNDTTVYVQGQTVTVLENTGDLVKTGCSFVGWNTMTNGTGTHFHTGSTFVMGKTNVTLYAEWNPTYTIIYAGNGNTGGIVPTDPTFYVQGQTVTVLGNTGNLVKTGFTFTGWNTLSSGSGTHYNIDSTLTMGTENVILYAHWMQQVAMVNVPGGTFTMKNASHTMTLSNFTVGKYEVTQTQYQAVTGTNPSSGFGIGAMYPVYYVSWYDAVEYCNKLSALEGLNQAYTITDRTPASGYPIASSIVTTDRTKNGYRLLTEAEWEYAARGASGGIIQNDYTYSGSDNINDVAWNYLNSTNTTQPVGGLAANVLGLYDMSGNVFEWCHDYYAGYPNSSQLNYDGPSSGSSRILRGGSWHSDAANCTVTYRDCYNPSKAFIHIGFRLARTQ